MKTYLKQLAQIISVSLLALFGSHAIGRAAVVNPKAFGASNQVLSYLMGQRDAGKIVSGQQNKLANGTRTDEDTQHVFDITSPQVYPAMIALDWGFKTATIDDMATGRADFTATAIDYWNLGSLVAFCWHQTNPKDATPDIGGWGSVQTYGSTTAAEFHDIVTPGTTLYNKWLAHVDLIAPYMKQLRDAGVVVIWRPYHEMNGSWFWWCGRSGADYRQLWINLYDRLVNYHGLNNLIWVWSPDKSNTNVAQYYPGSNYVDISGVDIYDGQNSGYYTSYPSTLASTAPGKPFALTECGLVPSNATLAATDYLWFVTWHSSFLDKNWSTPGWPADPTSSVSNTASTIQAIYANPAVITLNNIVFPRTYEAELVTSRGSGETISTISDVSLANGSGLKFSGNSVNDYVEFDVELPSAGQWEIKFRARKLNTNGQCQLMVVGPNVNVGVPQDLYAAAATNADYTPGGYTFATSGTKTLRFVVTGKNATSAGYELALDSITLTKIINSATAIDNPPSANVTYSGTWTHSADAAYFNATKSVSNTIGDYVQFSFTGGGAQLYVKTSPALGKLNISVDGGAPTLVDCYSASDTFRVKIFEVGGLLAGAHTLRATVATKNPASTGNYVGIDCLEPLPAWTAIDNPPSANVAYTGTWTHSTDAAYYNATKSVSSTIGDYGQFSFSGSGARLYVKTGSALGKLNISVDGGAPTLVDCYSASDTYQVKIFEVGGLPAGAHTLRATVATKNPASTGNYVGIDYMEFQP